MSKILLETAGDYMLQCPTTRQEIQHDRPSVVESSGFIEQRVGLGHLKVFHANLKNEATDEEFAKYLKDSDGKVDLAVSSFVAAFTADETKEEPARKSSKK